MNPEIDLGAFQRQRTGDSRSIDLVSPPRRILTRYVLPFTLIAAFAAVCAYAAKDALMPAVEVAVIQPVIASRAPIFGQQHVATATQDTSAATSPTTVVKPSVQEGGVKLFQAPGWIEPDPFTTIISSLIPGTITRVHVREGDTVMAGQLVAELDDADARIALSKAEATVAVRTAELESAQDNWENPIALEETIKTAQAETMRLEAEKAKFQKQAEFSRRQAEISRTLGLRGADSVLAAEKAAVEAKVAESEAKQIEAKILSQAATVDAAQKQSKLRLEDKSRLSLAKAQLQETSASLAEAKLRLERCRITSPTTGTVMRVFATPGTMVSMDVQHGTQIFSMYDPQQLQVRAEVQLADTGKIQIGLPAEFRVDALPDRIFHGELSRIVHEADVQRNSLPVKVKVLDPDPALKPEMIVSRLEFKSLSKSAPQTASPATQTQGGSQSADATSDEDLFVPKELLPKDSRGDATLWVVSADMKARQKAVKVGKSDRGALQQITAGLQPSDKIIISNTHKLKEGARVRIVKISQENKG